MKTRPSHTQSSFTCKISGLQACFRLGSPNHYCLLNILFLKLGILAFYLPDDKKGHYLILDWGFPEQRSNPLHATAFQRMVNKCLNLCTSVFISIKRGISSSSDLSFEVNLHYLSCQLSGFMGTIVKVNEQTVSPQPLNENAKAAVKL